MKSEAVTIHVGGRLLAAIFVPVAGLALSAFATWYGLRGQVDRVEQTMAAHRETHAWVDTRFTKLEGHLESHVALDAHPVANDRWNRWAQEITTLRTLVQESRAEQARHDREDEQRLVQLQQRIDRLEVLSEERSGARPRKQAMEMGPPEPEPLPQVVAVSRWEAFRRFVLGAPKPKPPPVDDVQVAMARGREALRELKRPTVGPRKER